MHLGTGPVKPARLLGSITLTESSIPVDLRNPGQVFASLGLLESADLLLGGALGGFVRSDGTDTYFTLRANGEEDPVHASLAFLGDANVDTRAVSPTDWWPADLPRKSEDPKVTRKIEKARMEIGGHLVSDVFPCNSPAKDTALPVSIRGKDGHQVTLQNWADGSSRSLFKLYSGNRSALQIMRAMINGTKETDGVSQIWKHERNNAIEHPFDVLTPMKGSFNFDPRGGWTALDAGYSLDSQNHQIAASPVVEIFAAWGMENARPLELGPRRFGYSVWESPLPPSLARAALSRAITVSRTRRFEFDLALSGKNKVTTFAREVSSD